MRQKTPIDERTYAAPKLKVFGEFSALTASGSTLLNEGTGTQRRQKLP
jgi:hypothetical protein